MSSHPPHICYAQSGGATAVINASASGLIQASRQTSSVGNVFVARNGILGVIHEELIDTSHESDASIVALKHTPGSAFGSCRHKLKGKQGELELKRIFEVFKAHNIGYFFYNGGNDSQDTLLRIANYAQKIHYPLKAIGIPKTIDNDLAMTHFSPGYPSAAKFLATITQEIHLELMGMCHTSTQVFILEVMGRNSGWLAGACGYNPNGSPLAPDLILFPERPFNEKEFLQQVSQCVKAKGCCMIVASEGVCDQSGQLLASSQNTDSFGHPQLGGVAPHLSTLIQNNMNCKHHWAKPDYIQRASRHLASALDVQLAFDLGKEALAQAQQGVSGVMLSIHPHPTAQNHWQIQTTPVSNVANKEKKLPEHFIRADNYGVTEDFQHYLKPLVTGEAPLPFSNGLPDYTALKNIKGHKKTGIEATV